MSAPKFDLKLWRAVLSDLGLPPREAKKGTEAYDTAMAKYRQSYDCGGGVGSSKAARVAPAPAADNVSRHIGDLSERIMADIRALNALIAQHEQEKQSARTRSSVRRSRSRSSHSKAARSSARQQLSDKLSSQRIDEGEEEERGGEVGKKAKSKRPLSAWQKFVKAGMQGKGDEDPKARMKELSQEWRGMKE